MATEEKRRSARNGVKAMQTTGKRQLPARGMPPIVWVIWAIPTASLCAVVLFVNIENANVARRVTDLWDINNETEHLDIVARDKARYVLLAVTLAIVLIHIVVSAVFFRSSLTLFRSIDKILWQFTSFFSKMDQHHLGKALIAVRDSTEVNKIAEAHEFFVVNFSPYEDVAAAQQEMSLANLWLREYGKFLPESLATGGEVERGSESGARGAANQEQPPTPPTDARQCQHGQEHQPNAQGAAGSGQCALEGTGAAERHHWCLADSNASFRTDIISSGSDKSPGGVSSAKTLRRRTATIVMAYYPGALLQRAWETGSASATAFVEIAFMCCQETQGLVLTHQPDRVVMCWNAFENQVEHQHRGLECAGRLGAELEKQFQVAHGQCSCVVVGVTGHVVAGFVRANERTHRVIFGDCVAIISEVGNLLYTHQLDEGLPGCRAWIAPAAAALTWPHMHHVPYEQISTKAGGQYTLYRILDSVPPSENEGNLAVSAALRRAFDSFCHQQYDTVLKMLYDVGHKEGYDDITLKSYKCLSANKKILFSVWERLKYLSDSYSGTMLPYAHQLPQWMQFSSDTVPDSPPSPHGEGAMATASGAATHRHRWRYYRPTLEAQLQLQQQQETVSSAAGGSDTAVLHPDTTPGEETTGDNIGGDRSEGQHEGQRRRSLLTRPRLTVAPNSIRDFHDVNNIHFRLTSKELGVTPTSRVVLGLSVSTGSLVAVKIVRFARQGMSAMNLRRLARDGYLVPSNLDVILAEVKTMSRMKSPLVVGYVTAAVFDKSSELFLVMEYVSGGSLHSIARNHKNSRMPLWLARRYLREVLESLKYLHRMNIVHCDIKPQNVLVPDMGPCKLSDFGISRAISEVSPTMRPHNGTPQYMAPEAFKGDLTQKADIYSFGVMLGEMVTGTPPPTQSASVPPEKCAVPEKLETESELRDARSVFVACTQKEADKRPTVDEVLSMPFFTKKTV